MVSQSVCSMMPCPVRTLFTPHMHSQHLLPSLQGQPATAAPAVLQDSYNPQAVAGNPQHWLSKQGLVLPQLQLPQHSPGQIPSLLVSNQQRPSSLTLAARSAHKPAQAQLPRSAQLLMHLAATPVTAPHRHKQLLLQASSKHSQLISSRRRTFHPKAARRCERALSGC
jgi:hypothetical protein